jgi:hypothetical protein
MELERLQHLTATMQSDSLSPVEAQELIREIRRLRSGELLLAKLDGKASQQWRGYVGSPIAVEVKHWLYD